jgi:hypothetical protein
VKVYSSQYLKRISLGSTSAKDVGNVERYVSERTEKLHDTKSGQAAETTHELKWQYFMTISFMNVVIIPRPTLSNVPAAEKSVLGNTRNFEEGTASTNTSISDNDNDEFSEWGFR